MRNGHNGVKKINEPSLSAVLHKKLQMIKTDVADLKGAFSKSNIENLKKRWRE